MKLTAALAGTLLLLTPAGVARAANMFAGPLFPTGDDNCECEIVNVTTSAKNIQIVMIGGDGTVLADTGVISVPAGHTATLISGHNGSQYCKFVNASPTSFRASIACFLAGATGAGSDFVALPAR